MDFTSYEIGDYFNSNALEWALSSNHLNSTVNYLYNEMDYKIQVDDSILKPICNKLFLIDFQLFIRIWDSIERLYSKLELIENYIIDFSYSIYCFSQESYNLKVNKLLNFIQCIFYSQIKINKESKRGKNSLLLKKIKKLIKYKNDKNDQTIIQSIKSIEKELNKYLIKKEVIKTGNISNVFKNKFSNNNNNLNERFSNHSKVKFEDFNLERELKRILILDFFIPFKTNNTYYKEKLLPNFLIEFASGFNEYQLILDFRVYLFDYFKDNSKANSIVLDWCRIISSRNANIELVSFIFDQLSYEINKTKDKYNDVLNEVSFGHHLNNPNYNSDQFDCRFFSIEHQINYLEILFKYNINYPITIHNVLNNIITNTHNIKFFTLKHYQHLAELIESYYNSHIGSSNYFKKFHSTILIGNNMAADYFFKNKNHLFHYWDGYFQKYHNNFI
ncbi:hypothetical protein ACTFIV_001206 [Dictyostelium citrinum]